MINIGSFHPPASTNKTSKYSKVSKSAAVAGSEVDNNAPKIGVESERRRKKDRRQRNVKTLIDMRSGRDRRSESDKTSIDITV